MFKFILTRLLRFLIFTTSLIIITFLFMSPLFALELRTHSQESAPKYFVDNGNMSGLCIEIISAVQENLVAHTITGFEQFVPFSRIQALLKQGVLDLFFCMKKSEARKSYLYFIEIPLYQVSYQLVSIVDDEFELPEDHLNRDIVIPGIILTVKGTEANRFIRQYKNAMIESASATPDIMLQRLLLARGRFAFYHNLGIGYLVKKKYSQKLKVYNQSFLTYSHFIAVRKSLGKEVIGTVESALKKAIDSGKVSKINQAYGLEH